MNDAMSGDTALPSVTLTNPEEQESRCSSRRTSFDSCSSRRASYEPLDTNHDSVFTAEDFPNDLSCSDAGANSGDLNDSLSYPSDRSLRSHRSSSSTNMQNQQQGKKKNKFWYHALTTNYKTKHQDFRRLFYGTPVSDNERLLVDFACALSKATNGLLLQGRMYITVNWICFYSKIIAFETKLTLDVRSILSVTKERTARVFPNAIQIVMERGDKYFFTSFASRDRTFLILSRIVQSVQSGQNISDEDFWEQVHDAYGDDLGLDSAEEVDLEYCCPPGRRPAEHHVPEASSNDPPPNIDLEERPIKEDEEEEEEEEDEDDDVDEEDEDEEVEDDDDDESTCTNMDSSPIVHGPAIVNGLADGKSTRAATAAHDVEPAVNGFSPASVNDSGDTKDEPEAQEQEEEVECKGHVHLDNEYLNTVIPMPLETVFNCLFTDSSFFKRVTTRQRTFEVRQSTWPEDPDENGEKERTIYYTLRLSNALGPKTSPTVEKQILLRPAYPEDERLQVTVDAKVRNGGVPYCDSFHVVNRYCLSRRSSKRTGLRVTSRVVYDKSIFFPAKTLIESTAKKGLGDYFEMIRTFLMEEASGHMSLSRVAPLGTRGSTKRQVIRKQKRKDNQIRRRVAEESESEGRHLAGFDTGEAQEADRMENSIIRMILSPERSWQSVIVFGLLLCLLFAVVCSVFMDVERITNDLFDGDPDGAGIASGVRDGGEKGFPHFSSAQDWASLLKHQDSVHRSELKRWRAVVDGTVTLMEEMRASLLRLRDTLDSLEKMPPPASPSSSPAPSSNVAPEVEQPGR